MEQSNDILVKATFTAGDYLSGGTHLYYVVYVHPDGRYLLENCRTGFSLTVDDDFVRHMTKLNFKEVKEKRRLPMPLPIGEDGS